MSLLRKLQKKFHGFSFSVKLRVFNMTVLVLILVPLFFVLTVMYLKARDQEAQSAMHNELNSIQNGVLDEKEVLHMVALQIASNGEIAKQMQEAIKNPKLLTMNLEVKTQFYRVLFPYILERNKVNRVCIYNDYGAFLYVGDALTQAESKAYITHSYLLNPPKLSNDNLTYFRITKEGFSIIKNIKTDPALGGKTVGYAEVEISYDQLSKVLFSKLKGDTGYVIYQLSTGRVIMSHFQNETDATQFHQATTFDSSIFPSQKYYQHLTKNTDLDLGFFAVHSKGQQKTFIIIFVAGASLLLLVLMLLLAWIQNKMMQRLTRPLVTLCDTVRHSNLYDKDRVSEKLVAEPDEFYMISEAFQKMLESLNQTMENNVAMRTAEVKAQLFAMQAQMNPHFIHNTLTIIQAYAGEQDYEMIDTICAHLSDMIRYSNEYTDDLVFIQQELSHVESYMELVKIRYEEDVIFRMENNIPPDTIKVPRFILQPLVENSLDHGLKQKEFPWEIRVGCFTEDNLWKVIIHDNGVGFTETEQKELYEFRDNLFKENDTIIHHNLKIGGLGIKNIMIRLYLTYGNDMIFEIDSHKMSYCNITIGGRFR